MHTKSRVVSKFIRSASNVPNHVINIFLLKTFILGYLTFVFPCLPLKLSTFAAQKMKELSPGIDIGKATVELREDGHLVIRIKDGQELDVEDIKALIEAKRKLLGNTPHTTVFIAGANSSISNEARTFASSVEAYDGAIAKSIVANELSTRLMGNFFIRFNKPPAPTRLFASEKEATQWLDQMRERLEKLN